LRAAAESVAQALNVPYAAIAVSGGSLLAESTHIPVMTGALTRWPLVYQGDAVGEVRAAERLPGEPLTDADQRLIADLLPQITLAARNAQLTHDLQESRQRAIGLLEDERRRLRRDLHDGLGPTLAAIMLNLDTALSRIDKGASPESIGALLSESRAMSESALGDVRRVAYNLRPPAIDDLGLTGALRQHAERLSIEAALSITVLSELGTRVLAAAVEVAVFRIVTEALTNIVHHARARNASVMLRIENAAGRSQLHVIVSDDGAGLPHDVRMGVGLRAMRERVAELDGALKIASLPEGGTSVQVCLPLGADG
jgi:signal transduction histidine kinase